MTIVTAHSRVVGGSTAKRVIACPGSVALCDTMPPKPSSKYADEGTLLHNIISEVLETNKAPIEFLGTKYNDVVFTKELLEDKLFPALDLLDEIDPKKEMEYATETRVGFGDYLPDVFGSTDLLGRLGSRAIVLDWKFGDGVTVTAEENEQLMFYAAAAMRTKESQWVFEGVTEIECIIIQPPEIRRWVTTPERIKAFENQLKMAVQIAQKPDAPLSHGDHCRWCAAKPVCPNMTGAVDRALALAIGDIDAMQISHYLKQADMLEQWVTDLRALAHTMLEAGAIVPEWKLVAKRATRQWVDEDKAAIALAQDMSHDEMYTKKLLSPAQAEKVLKKAKKELPADQVVAISSGSTLAPVDDPRPAVLQIGQQLTAALSKLQ
jgi:CRISPR/Cas system-associated exonuclease Cas4 (RecB family)